MSIIIKTPEQIEGIRKSSRLAASCLDYIEPYVEPGVSTGYLDKKIEDYIRAHGATPAPLNYHGFPKATCISPNNVVCHGIPSDDQILKNGDVINIDVTTILDGFYGDTSRMFEVGPIDDETARLLDVTKHCLDLGIQQVKPGNRFGNIGFMINRYAKSKGYSVVYEFCGHGVGLEFHEEPQVEHIARKNSGAKMKPGMVFTIEPMINAGKPKVSVDNADGWTARTIDEQLSAQYEHTILVTEDGYEVLTDLHNEY
ncbi:type I methionyl aminopeptidase [Salinivirga cyanobacteriivorans]|uniref:Methionine aminopeptidase n=1 Tax=Salinivirga cyanobacteriivorans TaxID=1307839 RepID=A0A0S2HUP3_9BACT|nr:type I methionyl aminopeptidase [Salinivirga cyanobacteriivorans]ALO13684.1 Methionine aminopeptidase [Salinivirga cyanobacteriivorans]